MSKMKKLPALLLAMVLMLCACGSEQLPEGVDVDLSRMSGTVVYGKVYDMVNNGKNYQDKIVRMQGAMSTIDVKEKGKVVDTLYSCVIFDAAGCCSQGIEFGLADQNAAYPAIGTEITVEGRWDWYQLYGLDRYRLLDAKVIK
ncbi:MAG: hypothetical protein IKI82_02695 [Lachnospiraceae bacterium]|nr:hypothetical protein [Lachnospiraceae bacterium]